MPDLPGGSSAAPTRYHTMWTTTGARRLVTTTTCMPLASVKVSGSNTAAPRDGAPASAATRTARAQRAFETIISISVAVRANAPVVRLLEPPSPLPLAMV